MAVGEKGMAPTRIVVHGRAAHGSTPRAGDNALVTAAEVVRRLDSRPPTDRDRRRVAGLGRRRRSTTRRCGPGCSTASTCGTTSTTCPAEQRVHAHACTHTTYTPTEVAGGLKSNIVPDEITLGLDVRTVPGETSDDVQRFLDQLLADLPVTITIVHRTEPTRSDRATPVWRSLERAVQHAHPGGRVAPTLFTGAHRRPAPTGPRRAGLRLRCAQRGARPDDVLVAVPR